MFARNHRNKLINNRISLSDEEFNSRIAARTELHQIIIATREALARICQVPAGFIYPDDKPESVLKLVTLDWDDIAVVMELEEILNIEIADDANFPSFLGQRFFWWAKPGPCSISEWCVNVAEYIYTKYGKWHVG
jgi:hypothetical protein